MTDKQIIEIVETEIKVKTFAVTEQYLEIHDLIYKDGKPTIVKINRENTDGVTSVYLPVLNERFYYVVYIDSKSGKVIGFSSEPFCKVYFRATSEKFSEAQLKSMTKLTPSESWNKGDLRKNGKSIHTFSSIVFIPNPEPDDFESKLNRLLSFLEQDKEGIKQLVDKAFGYIQVAMTFHNANGMLGGPSIYKDSMNRMNQLNLEIDFDLYVSGKEIK